ncbi:MAG: site-specific integrase [Paenibacillus sp.]|uniref:tyrosine-type recombinase/integrase n=1 Tax=Paenibacillus sp. TaxID=58172 RepID=UPI0029017754|nr:site-specific integrase [Paenibacillus sp.]MDU2242007.1 site-specific integrase [Paenibacillus sp.]
MDSDQEVRDLFKSNHWKQNAKTISPNASYANSTSQECLESTPTGNHDIKSLSWKKVLLFLNTMYAFRWPEEDKSNVSLGSHGLNEWLYKTQVQNRIFAPTVLDYLNKKYSLKSTSFFSLIQYALELIDFYKTRYGLDARFIQDKELANKDALINFIEHSSCDIVQRNMLLAIGRKLISIEFDLKKPINDSSTEKRMQDINHPAITTHIKELLRSGVKEKTVNSKYKMSYSLFLNWLNKTYVQFQNTSCNELPLSLLTEEHLLEFKQYLLRLEKKGVHIKQTVSNCFYDIRFLLANLYKMGWLAKDITLDVTGIPYERYYYRELPTDDELHRFSQTIQVYSDHPILELAAFGLMLCLGLRIHEVANIRFKDVNIENRTLSVFGKNEKSAILPLPDPLLKYFQQLIANKGQDAHVFGDNNQSTIRSLRALYKLYAFVAGWNYQGGPHLLRHTFISRLSEHSDCPPQLLMYLARHERPENTARYVHRNHKQLQNAINKIKF